MKRSLTLLVALLFITASTFAQDTVKGGFKNCTVYEYKSKFGEIDKSTKTKYKFLSFDKMGRNIEEILYRKDGDIKFKHTKNFNEKGQLIKEFEFQIYDSPGYQDSYKYDDKGNIIEYSGYTADGFLKSKHKYKYNDRGKLLVVAYYNGEGNLNEKTNYNYNVNDSLLEKLVYNSKSELVEKTTYNYNAKGKLVEFTYFDLKRVFVFKKKYVYDERGNLLEEKQITSIGEGEDVENKISYMNKYKYNEQNKPIEKIIYSEDLKIVYKYNYIYNIYGNLVTTICAKSDKIDELNSNNRISNDSINYVEYYINSYKYNENSRLNEKTEYVFENIYKQDYEGENLIVTKVFTNYGVFDFENYHLINDSIYKKHEKFDDSGNTIEKTIIGTDYKETYKYDKKGNLIEEVKYEQKELEQKINFVILEKKTYKYDNFGNKIEEIVYNKLDEPEIVIEYVYTK